MITHSELENWITEIRTKDTTLENFEKEWKEKVLKKFPRKTQFVLKIRSFLNKYRYNVLPFDKNSVFRFIEFVAECRKTVVELDKNLAHFTKGNAPIIPWLDETLVYHKDAYIGKMESGFIEDDLIKSFKLASCQHETLLAFVNRNMQAEVNSFSPNDKYNYYFNHFVAKNLAQKNEILLFWDEAFNVEEWKNSYNIDLRKRPYYNKVILPFLEGLKAGSLFRLDTAFEIIQKEQLFVNGPSLKPFDLEEVRKIRTFLNKKNFFHSEKMLALNFDKQNLLLHKIVVTQPLQYKIVWLDYLEFLNHCINNSLFHNKETMYKKISEALGMPTHYETKNIILALLNKEMISENNKHLDLKKFREYQNTIEREYLDLLES